MPSFKLEWTIDWDAETPIEAAQEVVRQFFGNVGTADHFTVTDLETGEVTEVDAFSGDDEEAADIGKECDCGYFKGERE
jgi:hypothetical protein